MSRDTLAIQGRVAELIVRSSFDYRLTGRFKGVNFSQHSEDRTD